MSLNHSSRYTISDKASDPWKEMNIPIEVSKNVLYIPIYEIKVRSIKVVGSKEPLVDLLQMHNPRIKPLSEIDSKYTDNYEGYSKVRKGLYEKLMLMLNFLSSNIGIAYSEGFRPIKNQKGYFDKKMREMLSILKDKELAYKETSKFISPFIDNIPPHCAGAAIDMTLFNLDTNQQLDLGDFDVVRGINNQGDTFSKNTTQVQRANRLLLLEAATRAGLVNYGFEWWHYSFGDRAWAYVKGKDSAMYDLVDTDLILLDNGNLMTKDEYLRGFSE